MNRKREEIEQIDRILQSAIVLPLNQRAAFLDKACTGNRVLRLQVECLLDHYEGGKDVLEQPLKPRPPADHATASRRWQIGDRIQERWEIYKILRGGMGVVYIVYDHQRRDAYAAKTFRQEVLTDNPVVVDRFTREALAWINLDVHQNVVQARFAEKIEDHPYLFLEYVSGGDLSSWIGTPRLREDLPQVLRFAIQFCDGMTHALSKGIRAHRDIKPQNCLITRDGTLKVTDFGLAKTFDDWAEAAPEGKGLDGILNGVAASRQVSGNRDMESPHPCVLSVGLTPTGMVAGTPSYMAPEQFDDIKYLDARADIYSFGVMLFQMVTGHLPFIARGWEEFRHLHKSQPPPSLEARFSALRPVVESCLAKQPVNRFADFVQVRQQLAEIYETLSGMTAPEPAFGEKLEATQETVKGVNLNTLGRPQEAVACHDRALELDPRLAMAWYNKGGALTSLERFDEATSCYDRALELNPLDHEAWTNKGVLLGHVKRYEESLDCQDRALEINPLSGNAWFNKGRSLGEMGRWDDALACYDRALELNPRDSDAWHNKGVALNQFERSEEALACYDRALELDPSSGLAWRNKGATLVDAGRPEAALACFDRALELKPSEESHEKTWCNKGVALGGLNRFQDAIVCYDRAIEINTRYEDAWIGKGVQLDKLSRHEEALACYDRALEMNPTHDVTLFNKSVALVKLGQVQGALACCDRAIELDPGRAQAWANKGTCLHEAGRYDEAVESFDRALELKPQFAEAWSNRGGTLYATERREEAIASFDRALELNPVSAETWSNKAAVLEDLDRMEEAIACYDRAVESRPGYDHGWFGKGTALAKLGRYKEANDCYERAIKINPSNAGAWYHEGMALSELGDMPTAIAYIDRALEIDPNNASAWYNKGVLLGLQGSKEDALVHFDRATQVSPIYENAWYNKADVLREFGRWEEALVCYDRVLDLNSRDGQAWFNKGTLLFNMKRYEEAMTCAKQALEFGRADARQVIELCNKMIEQSASYTLTSDANADEWVDKAVELAQANQLKEALICFDRALALDPRLERAWFNKAIAMSKSGRLDDALACLERVLEMNSRNETAWYDRGNLLRAMRRFEEALSSYDRAIELNPRYLYAWGNKGAVFSDMRRPEEAIACYDRAIEIDPNDATAWFSKGAVLFNLVKRFSEALACFEQAGRLGNPEAAQAIARCELSLQPVPGTVEVEADSSDEAIAELVSRVPEGLYLLSVTWFSDGQPKVVQAIAETILAAFEKAQSEVPVDAIVKDRKEVSLPEEKLVRVEAFDEASARAEALRQGGKTAVIRKLSLVTPGGEGFFGIGKRPSKYEAEVFQPAAVEIIYQQKARLSAQVGGLVDLVGYLVQIGRKFPADDWSASHFLGQARHRARQIGEELNETGGIKLMLAAHEVVGSQLGSGAARELEAAWDGIGEWAG